MYIMESCVTIKYDVNVWYFFCYIGNGKNINRNNIFLLVIGVVFSRSFYLGFLRKVYYNIGLALFALKFITD